MEEQNTRYTPLVKSKVLIDQTARFTGLLVLSKLRV